MSVKGPVLGQTEAIVKNALAHIIKTHTGEDALDAIDEIVLSYVVSIVDSLSSGLEAPEDSFDADLFAEMMVAYIPSFASINCSAVSEWMMELCSSLKKTKGSRSAFTGEYRPNIQLSMEIISNNLNNGQPDEQEPYNSIDTNDHSQNERNPCKMNEDKEDAGHIITKHNQHLEEGLELLSEMFPNVSLAELRRTLAIASSDCQKAAQLLLIQKQDDDESSSSSSSHFSSFSTRTRTTSSGSLEEDFLQQDKQLREHILNRYAYIDQDDDVREHRPVAPKSEPKKLIRYRDNKIVSIKGERYSEVKSEDGDDMKKTFVSLKPARQYRFH